MRTGKKLDNERYSVEVVGYPNAKGYPYFWFLNVPKQVKRINLKFANEYINRDTITYAMSLDMNYRNMMGWL